MIEQLLIVGGSVRAAAMSALRAGFEPIAIDRFADADLQRVCSEFQRYDELRQLPELTLRTPVTDWIYAGPLENYPELIEQLRRQRNLLGNDATTLRQLRDPWCVSTALARAGLRSPELGAAGEVPDGHDWLRKPLRAAGGYGIKRSGLAHNHGGSVYFQKFVSGRSVGATFLGARGRAVLVGVTEQLLGPAWGGSREFQYVGSLGPVVLSSEQTQALRRVGDCIAEDFPVQGLYGVDAIINDDGVWPVEVNPRYAASVEILERARNIPTIRWHVAACRSGDLPDFERENPQENGLERYGKAVVYADRQVVVEARLERALSARNCEDSDPMVADVPVAGTSLEKGDPVVTVFAKGRTNAEVREGLRTAIVEAKRLFHAS